MRAYQIGDQQGLESLTLVERSAPECGSGQALVRVLSMCLNHRDLNVLSGQYGARRPAERTPGSDGVGEVIAVGAGVTQVKAGDRVTCGHFVTWLDGAFTPAAFGVDVGTSVDGWLAEQLVVPAAALVKLATCWTKGSRYSRPAGRGRILASAYSRRPTDGWGERERSWA